MMLTHNWKPVLRLVLAAVLGVAMTACAADPAAPVQTAAPETTAAQETISKPTETQHRFELNVEITEAPNPMESTVPTIPMETNVPDESEENEENEFLDATIPEDTAPPVIIEITDETKPVTEFEVYNNMSEEEQAEFYNSFPNEDAFFEWYNNAKAEYEAVQGDVIMDGSTNIEIHP